MWPTTKLEELTLKAIETRKTTMDRKRLSASELRVLPSSAVYTPGSEAWYLEFEVLRANTSKSIFISMISCNGHVEFGSRS
jgi:hypothetical protein